MSPEFARYTRALMQFQQLPQAPKPRSNGQVTSQLLQSILGPQQPAYLAAGQASSPFASLTSSNIKAPTLAKTFGAGRR